MAWSWPSLERAYLGERLSCALPGFDPRSVCSALDLARLRLVRAFEVWRVEHMGCAIVLPVAFLIAFLLKMGLDVIATPNGSLAQKLEFGLIATWILALAITSHTHFSGRETLKERYRLALVFWGATLSVPIGFIAVAVKNDISAQDQGSGLASDRATDGKTRRRKGLGDGRRGGRARLSLARRLAVWHREGDELDRRSRSGG